eukprot:Skav200131  [mRNA]  locus=scaffold4172:109515:110336:+ [translate_table: standard]
MGEEEEVSEHEDDYDGPVVTTEEINLLSESTGQSEDLCLLVLMEASHHFSGAAKLEMAAEMLMKRLEQKEKNEKTQKENEDPGDGDNLEAALKLSMQPLDQEPAASSSATLQPAAPAAPAAPAGIPPSGLKQLEDAHRFHCRVLQESVEFVMARTGLSEAECREAFYRHGKISEAVEVLNKRSDLKDEDPELQAALKLSMLAAGKMGSYQREEPSASSSSPAQPASLPSALSSEEAHWHCRLLQESVEMVMGRAGPQLQSSRNPSPNDGAHTP